MESGDEAEDRSRPEEKAEPAPERTMTFTAGSDSRSEKRGGSSEREDGVMAFNVEGEERTMWATPVWSGGKRSRKKVLAAVKGV